MLVAPPAEIARKPFFSRSLRLYLPYSICLVSRWPYYPLMKVPAQMP